MNVLEKFLEEVKALKRNQDSSNQDFLTDYISALSTVEGFIAGLECCGEISKTINWIPAEERLPNDPDELVLVTASGKYGSAVFANAVLIANYADDGGWIVEGWENWIEPNVTAWMPLPEPYKPEGR